MDEKNKKSINKQNVLIDKQIVLIDKQIKAVPRTLTNDEMQILLLQREQLVESKIGNVAKEKDDPRSEEKKSPSLAQKALKGAQFAFGDDRAQIAAAGEVLGNVGRKIFGKLFRKKKDDETPEGGKESTSEGAPEKVESSKKPTTDNEAIISILNKILGSFQADNERMRRSQRDEAESKLEGDPTPDAVAGSPEKTGDKKGGMGNMLMFAGIAALIGTAIAFKDDIGKILDPIKSMLGIKDPTVEDADKDDFNFDIGDMLGLGGLLAMLGIGKAVASTAAKKAAEKTAEKAAKIAAEKTAKKSADKLAKDALAKAAKSSAAAVAAGAAEKAGQKVATAAAGAGGAIAAKGAMLGADGKYRWKGGTGKPLSAAQLAAKGLSNVVVGAGEKLAPKIAASIAKNVPKGLGKALGKSLPLVGWGIGAGLAVWELMKGNYVGAGLEVVGAAGSALTAIPAAIASIANDVYKDVYGAYPIDDKKTSAEDIASRMADITRNVKNESVAWLKKKGVISDEMAKKLGAPVEGEEAADDGSEEREDEEAGKPARARKDADPTGLLAAAAAGERMDGTDAGTPTASAGGAGAPTASGGGAAGGSMGGGGTPEAAAPAPASATSGSTVTAATMDVNEAQNTVTVLPPEISNETNNMKSGNEDAAKKQKVKMQVRLNDDVFRSAIASTAATRASSSASTFA